MTAQNLQETLLDVTVIDADPNDELDSSTPEAPEQSVHFDAQMALFDHLAEIFDENTSDTTVGPGEFDIKTLPSSVVEHLQKFWPEEVRLTPSVFLHSPMFGMVEKGERPKLVAARLPSRKGTTILYTGDALSQSDLDVWMGIIYTSKLKLNGPGEAMITVDVRRFMKQVLGRAINRNWLFDVLDRLYRAEIEVITARVRYKGRLINSTSIVDNRYITVGLNNAMNPLFHNENNTIQNAIDRKSITGDIGRWLYGYLFANSQQTHFSLITIKELCGSKSPAAKFKFMIKNALDELQRLELIKDYKIDKNYVNVERCRPKALHKTLAVPAPEPAATTTES